MTWFYMLNIHGDPTATRNSIFYSGPPPLCACQLPLIPLLFLRKPCDPKSSARSQAINNDQSLNWSVWSDWSTAFSITVQITLLGLVLLSIPTLWQTASSYNLLFFAVCWLTIAPHISAV